ncbi:hypothetical protein B0H14DRAFT_3571055 [Mycena olivaceomarginata]|nr:hypothetical protein B0H14DRAFT_3571055 [Mycena olivaceomarginata]
MNKPKNKRKRATTYNFGARPDGMATASTSATTGSALPSVGLPPAAVRTRVLREKTRIRQSDGHVSQARAMIDVAVAREQPPRVHPDVARERPVYDWYSGEDVDVDRVEEEDLEEEDGRQARNSDHPLRQWAEDHLSSYLEEILRLEGRGDCRSDLTCRLCNRGRPDHRCRTCLGGAHARLPFHVIEYWTGAMFERRGLKDMGLRLQLGHWHDRNPKCPVPQAAANDDFVIVDVHGVHEVGLDYCGCGQGGHPTVQLLRAELWPATTTNPKTAATFAVLRQHQLLSFESKCSALEFYSSLARQTDNLGSRKRKGLAQAANNLADSHEEPKFEKDRYHAFLRMTREWRHVRMLKRAGRGHDPKGLANTKPGECALLCPACPQPGKNLPPNWENAPENKRAISRHRRKLSPQAEGCSTEERDPGLGNGLAFFNDINAYMDHVKRNWDQKQDRSHCVAHDAVDKPDREARGTASSGIGTVDCARHNMKRPLAVGDLQLGERIAGSPLLRFFVSYDIACQWHINIWRRLAAYQDPDLLVAGNKPFYTFLVPKFHLPAHIEACNLRFSFHLTPEVGQTDGEAPERGWANANPLARSTRRWVPARDATPSTTTSTTGTTKKSSCWVSRLWTTLRKKTEVAVEEMVTTREALADLEDSLGAEDVKKWTKMAELWEKDVENPNPFETQRKDMHVAKVRAELAEEAAAREAAGVEETGAVRGDMHITELVGMGLQLEDQQRILASDVAANRSASNRPSAARYGRAHEQTATQDLCLDRGLANIRDREDQARAQTSSAAGIPGIAVPDIQLWLPSAIAGASREVVQDVRVDNTTYLHEYRLRVGQGEEALHEVRRLLLVRTHLYKLKDTHSRGVRANMRSQDKIAALNGQVQRAADQYRAARSALVVLGGVLRRNEWERTLRVLNADDVRGLPQSKFHDPERKKKGKSKRRGKKLRREPREVSWIWLTQGGQYDPGDKAAMNEALTAVRIDWAKVRARCHRWREEVDLLEAEMARVTRFLDWRAQWWREQVGRRTALTIAQSEGETAYALRQAGIQEQLARGFAEEWETLPALILRGRAGELSEAAVGETLEEDGSDEDGASDEEEEAPIAEVRQREIKSTYVDEVLAM